MPPFLKYDSAKRHGQKLLIKELESRAFSPAGDISEINTE